MWIKYCFPLFILFFSFIFAKDVSANPVCCVEHGGGYACDSTNGTLYCRDGTISIDCTCRIINTPTPLPIPMKKPTPSIPECPPFSTYGTKSKMCECDNGYTVLGNSCVTNNSYCWEKFGGNSIYNKDKNACACAQGYVWNKDGKSCITYNKVCQDLLGLNSYYNSQDNTCNCYEGYSIQNNKCDVIPTKTPAFKTETKKAFPTPTSVPEPTIAIKLIKSPTPTIASQKKEPKIVVNDKENKSYVTEEKKDENIVIRIMGKIWEFITEIF